MELASMHKIFQVRREQRKLALLSGADFNSSGRQIKRFAFYFILRRLVAFYSLVIATSQKCGLLNKVFRE